ncbi:MAG: hypothetical protein QW320_11110 [Ignisphaera sp.]
MLEEQKKEIEIDLSDLYGLGGPEESAGKLLMRILEYYKLTDRVVFLVSFAFDDPQGKGDIIINKLKVDYDEALELVEKRNDLVLIRVLDGYDWAEAIVQVDVDDP